LPARAEKKTAKVIATLTNGDYTVSKSTPLGKEAPEKAVTDVMAKTIVGVVERASKNGMSTADIAEIVDLKEDQVESILKGASEQSVSASVMVEIEATIFLLVQRNKLEAGTVELVVATRKDHEIAKHSITVADVLANDKLKWKPGRPTTCKGASGDVFLDVEISIYGTQQMSTDEGLEFGDLN
jgi:hypothetical protein